MSDLYACPFCREMFARGEVTSCPHCDIAVRPLAELPPSYDAAWVDPREDAVPPEDELLPWGFAGRGRGPLLLLGLVGIGVFFAPWLHETAPEIRTWSGFRFAVALPWLWAAGVAWAVMVPLVASRRTIRQMRGARVAVSFLVAMVLLTVVVRLVAAVPTHPLIPISVTWGWGLYATGGLAVLALGFALSFGGKVDDMPSRQVRPLGETLH